VPSGVYGLGSRRREPVHPGRTPYEKMYADVSVATAVVRSDVAVTSTQQ
jgi:hypothetical protein